MVKHKTCNLEVTGFNAGAGQPDWGFSCFSSINKMNVELGFFITFIPTYSVSLPQLISTNIHSSFHSYVHVCTFLHDQFLFTSNPSDLCLWKYPSHSILPRNLSIGRNPENKGSGQRNSACELGNRVEGIDEIGQAWWYINMQPMGWHIPLHIWEM